LKQRLSGWSLACVLTLFWAAIPCVTAASPAVTDGVLRATLSNGLRVVIVPDRLAPVVTTKMNYLAGSNDSPEGFPGTAHALEHMMFRGSKGMDRDQLAELGALLGGAYNADTTETVTQYTYTVLADDLGVVLRSEALRMGGLSLNGSDWDRERGAIEQEVSQFLSSPLYRYPAQLQAILFAGTPYAHDALGTRPSFERTDVGLLRQFYARWYAPNNAVLVIAGDVRPARALAEVQAAFGGIPRRAVPEHARFATRPPQPQTLVLPTGFPVGLVTIAYRMPGLKEPDFPAADILADVLGSQRGALYGLVPAGRALTAQFSCQPKADVGFGTAVSAFPAGDDPAPLLDAMRRIIAAVAHGGVPPELVATAKRHELALRAFQNDSIEGLAGTWSEALAFQGARSPGKLAKAYAAVTVADVNRLARQLLAPDHAVTVILTPGTSAHPEASEAGFGGTESFSILPDHPVALPPWVLSALADPHPPEPVDPPDVSVLPNGLRLIVQPEHVSRTVSVIGRVREVSKVQEPPGKEGISVLMRGLFRYGTTSMDRLAFRRALDDIAAAEGAGQSFRLKTTTPAFGRGMRLLADNMLRPAFPPEAFAMLRDQLAHSLAGLLQSPDYLYERALNRATVPDGDPTLRHASPATVMALQRSDLQAYYAATFRPDLTTIVVIGDVTPERARRVVGQTFGAWRGTGPVPAIDLPPIGPSPPSQALVQDGGLQDRVSMTETVSLPIASPDRYTLMLGNAILGDGLSSRLYRDLRINSGYAYSVSSALDWTRTRAGYTVAFGADAGSVEKARLLVLRDIRDMQTIPVSGLELTRAKALLLRRLPMQRASVETIASLYLRQADLGLPLESERTVAARYLGITAPQIQQAFATWLRPDDFAQIVEGPPTAP